MGVQILANQENNTAVLFCSTSMWAFGPVFDSEEQARAFLKWIVTDPRGIEDSVMERKYLDFCALTKEQQHEAGLCETLGIEYECAICEDQRKLEDADACPECRGNQRVPDTGIWTKKCPACNGTGKASA